MIEYWFSLVGVGVFAASGTIAAIKKNYDIIGVLAIAVVTALGGGTLRDLLLGAYPILWVQKPAYVWGALLAAIATLLYVRHLPVPQKLLTYADALGLALFSISGAQVAEHLLVSPIVVVIMAVLTGTAGGVIRDLLTAEVPPLFRSGETYYATPVILGVVFYLSIENFLSASYAAVLGMFLIAAVRILAVELNWHFPAFKIRN